MGNGAWNLLQHDGRRRMLQHKSGSMRRGGIWSSNSWSIRATLLLGLFMMMIVVYNGSVADYSHRRRSTQGDTGDSGVIRSIAVDDGHVSVEPRHDEFLKISGSWAEDLRKRSGGVENTSDYQKYTPPKYPGWQLAKSEHRPSVEWVDNPEMKELRKSERKKREEARVRHLLRREEREDSGLEMEVIKLRNMKQVVDLRKRSLWRPDPEGDTPDQIIRLIRDQSIMGRAYQAIAEQRGMRGFAKDLRYHSREVLRVIGDATGDAQLNQAVVTDRMRAIGYVLKEARRRLYDPQLLVKKMRTVVQSMEDQIRSYRKLTTYLREQAAKTFPKGLHCLSLQLTVDYEAVKKRNGGILGRVVAGSSALLADTSLHHYCLFTDNVLAASVVVNSTISNTKSPERHVFHLVTDSLNLRAMRVWFSENPPRGATLEIQNIDEFTWLNASYCPVLKQLQDENTKDYFFGRDSARSIAGGTSNIKYRNPKYLSMLNHVRFYLPELYPELDKILFLDDDIVVRRDLRPLWDTNMQGCVNAAVFTCGESFHRFDKYLNFSDPLISETFKPDDCGWAYGMNMFDLQQWKAQNITGIYHSWQEKNKDRTLWKLGTLPPGLITFYNKTFALNNTWHVLGLGYNPNLDIADIEGAAVIHWNGNMKPWLDTAISKFKLYWTAYVDFANERLLKCNIQAPSSSLSPSQENGMERRYVAQAGDAGKVAQQ